MFASILTVISQLYKQTYGHVAYQIKGYEMTNNVLANILSPHTHSTSRVKVIAFSSESIHVAHQIKGSEA